jgi:DNA topoisomerase-6 subunit A
VLFNGLPDEYSALVDTLSLNEQLVFEDACTALRDRYERIKLKSGSNEEANMVNDNSRGVRRLARRLHEEYKLPVYVLVDNDPWGYYIYSVVKQGSINLAFESQRMAIPKAKFIGLSSADPERYELPRNVGIKLNEKDIARAKELTNYQWFQKPAWQAEIKRMLTSGLKYELDALANKDFQYLTKKYLPRKLKEKDWLD